LHIYVINGNFMVKLKKIEVGKKMIRSSLVILLFSFLFFGCHVAIHNTPFGFDEHETEISQSTNFRFPVESFTFILVKHEFEFEECSDEPECIIDAKKMHVPTVRVSGSGAVIDHTKKGTALAITAAHVCTAKSYHVFLRDNVTFLYNINVEIEIISYYGKKYPANVVAIDKENDICIVEAKGKWGKPVKIASEMSPIGARVFNMAAPHGIFEPGMVVLLEGFYSGSDMRDDTYYTVPAAPGSSGSVIMNSRGEIISVIHSAYRSFQSLGIGSHLNYIKILMAEVEDKLN